MARGRARIERHGANHGPGGSDPIAVAGGGELGWEDVGTTTPITLPPLRFLYLSKYIYNEVTTVDNPIDFHVKHVNDPGYTPIYWTNDTSGGTSETSVPHNAAWSSDYFYSNGPPDGPTAFFIRPGLAVYLLEVTAYLYVGSPNPFNGFLTVNAPAPSGDTYSHGLAPFGSSRRKFALNDSDNPRPGISHQSLIPIANDSGNIPVSISMRQDSGSTSIDGPSVVMMRCVRLSPPEPL